jgi:glucosamine--fructose-6-phosphate aminotransferase (isomerizing)
MCGIVAYIGKRDAAPILIDGLKRLEYRGYDSAGFALGGEERTPFLVRTTGRVAHLEKYLRQAPRGTVGIAHTRWATHGEPSERNAHPHSDCTERLFIVHNGIIENYAPLRDELLSQGHTMRSDTDTEVVAHLVESFFEGNLEDAVTKALAKLRGTWAFALFSQDDPEKIVVARNSSPLIIGIGDGEYLIASDASAILPLTKRVLYLEDGEMAVLTREELRISNVDDAAMRKRLVEIPWTLEEAEKGGHPHFMHKEIHEAPTVIENALRGRIVLERGSVKLGGLEDLSENLRTTKRIILTGMGTAYHAALLGEYFLEELAGIPAEAHYAAEFRYRDVPAENGTVLIAVSQSGETADTIAAIRRAKTMGMRTLGVVNVVGSTIARETDGGVYNHAGPEIGVASTKAFLSQLAVLALIAVFWGRMAKMSHAEARRLLSELLEIPEKVRTILKREGEIRALAEKYARYDDMLFLGRKWSYPVALEGALKLKEVSYVHAEGYNAAEMKHGPIAMINEEFPVVAIVPSDIVREKTLSNLEEVRARKGPILAIATEGDREIATIANDVFFVPETHEAFTPILTTVPLQLFAYAIGVARGCDVDKPRNLAKSVTVE